MSFQAKVFRVRNLPAQLEGNAAAAVFITDLIDGLASEDIGVCSLASEKVVIPGERQPRKVATVTFKTDPRLKSDQPEPSEWQLQDPNLQDAVIVDTHFRGITPLNDVDPNDYEYDCIAVSGLSSHPFGSWQPHGGDKSFMWIRDALPKHLPGVKFFLYGYDSTIVASTSTQTIRDLSASLINTLEANEWSSPTTKQLLFLVHSLGGVILKQVLVMLANSGARETFLLSRVKGGICFGVPSRGLPFDHMLTLMSGRPNEILIRDLSDKSEYIASLEEQFTGIAHHSQLTLIWAFETKLTQTTVRTHVGGFSRSGPGCVLVPRDSATKGLCYSSSSTTSTMQIDEDHSNMVKFSDGDNNLRIVVSKLKSVCGTVGNSHDNNPQIEDTIMSSQANDPQQSSSHLSIIEHQEATTSQRHTSLLESEWDLEAVLSSLQSPERDRRLEQIEPKFEHTFDWIFDDESVGFTNWLREGQGVFWIRGKPASGKSTLMKFIYQDPRTHELLSLWKPKSYQLTANFFFHHRGSLLQKSFEGLLRSLLSQILRSRPELSGNLLLILQKKYIERLRRRGIQDLAADTYALLICCGANHGIRSQTLAQETVRSWNERTGLREQSNDLGENIRRLLESLNLPLNTDSIREKIEKIVDNQISREAIKDQLLSEPWTRSALEEGLIGVLDQKLFNVDICLFLDALDEYNGRPESIAYFLEDIIKQTASSQTKLKICFSSRPWNVFISRFESCPGCRIHEHTENDVRDYCIGSVLSSCQHLLMIYDMIPDIVIRAKGVFLWVKLVLQDLTAAASATIDNGVNLSKLLRMTLDSLPDDLDRYYATIIERLPAASRWNTYVVLESVARSGSELSPHGLLAVLECQTASSMETLDDRWAAIYDRPQDWAEAKLRALSGGLLDFIKNPKIPTTTSVQLMHQTIKDFVENPGFKLTVLGLEGTFRFENGHTFLSTYYFMYAAVDLFHYHARQAEVTTGRSQYALLSRTDNILIRKFDTFSLARLAVRGQLDLLIQDVLQYDPRFVKRSHRDVLDTLQSLLQDKARSTESVMGTMTVLLNGGIPITEYDAAPFFQDASDTQFGSYIFGDGTEPRTSEERIALGIAIGTAMLNRFICMNPGADVQNLMDVFLHASPPALAEYLLNNGADPNTCDQRGRTPLDNHVLYFWRSECSSADYETIRILVRHGGVPYQTSRKQWIKFLGGCRKGGFETEIFTTYDFSQWFEKQRWQHKATSIMDIFRPRK